MNLLLHGDWRAQLSNVSCDSVITDPPYSRLTVEGQRSGNDLRESAIDYDWYERDDIVELCASWSKRTRRWFVMFGDHLTWAWAYEAMDKLGWYVFPPVIWVKNDPAPRFAADGPTSAVEHIMVARTRVKLMSEELFYRPGWYKTSTASSRSGEKTVAVGGKPLWLMRALVRDYSLPGELIADPCAGGATTLLAARAEGRECVGAEKRDHVYQAALKRMSAPFNQELF